MTEPPAGDPQAPAPAPEPNGDPFATPSVVPPQPPYAQPYAPAFTPPVGPGMYVDPASGLVLPQGVQLASVGRRIGAYFLSIVLAIVTLGIGYVVWGLVVWRNGQTPALQVLGMRCWRHDAQQVPGFWWMALREIVGRFVDGVLSFITLLISFVLFVSGKEHKSLHDHVAGTVVLHDPQGSLAR
jgi:uncharacterized RDD family membrane protein YckC